MKKILLIISSVFLLFPAAIYFGNLADIPEAREIIVYLRDLVGMSATKEPISPASVDVEEIPTAYTHIELVESWRNLGASNFTNLLQLIATPRSRDAWQANAGNFLDDPLHSAAFFLSSWHFWQVQQEKLSLIGYYQPWIDVLLLIQVAEVEGSYKAVAIGITEPSSVISSTTPTAMAEELTARLKRAEHTFHTVIDNPDTLVGMLNPTVAKKSQNLLNQYVTDLGGKLITNNSENQNRSAILEWLNTVQAGQFKEGELVQQSNEWLKKLQPVRLIKIDSEHWLLAASNSTQAERVLLVQLRVTEHKAQPTEVRIWDAATIKNTQ
ncbi:MAG: hypothetical protein CG439_429 [Methylococcaceae bacterium NSP1-2]|nr:hypothetical protein [Methylococcaceae bacterium]OYV20528.1 MAG: hypothetical protein CG439_429 [Methylococcaceae bacterium NSP1-2]